MNECVAYYFWVHFIFSSVFTLKVMFPFLKEFRASVIKDRDNVCGTEAFPLGPALTLGSLAGGGPEDEFVKGSCFQKGGKKTVPASPAWAKVKKEGL